MGHAVLDEASRKVHQLEELQRGNPRVSFACTIRCSFEDGASTRRAPTRLSTRVLCMQNSMQHRARCTHSKTSNAAINACALPAGLMQLWGVCKHSEGLNAVAHA